MGTIEDQLSEDGFADKIHITLLNKFILNGAHLSVSVYSS